MSQQQNAEIKIAVTFRHTEPTEALKKHAEDKLMHTLQKYLHHHTSVHVILSVEKRDQTAEVIVESKNHSCTAKATSTDLYLAIDKAAENVTTQLRKQKEKMTDHKVQPVAI